ncbi:MAG: hypothetical protein M3483_05315 [Gemmatimonadota bacterium]|nr:hypothetical protein [Gemmatimonadota bacterium]
MSVLTTAGAFAAGAAGAGWFHRVAGSPPPPPALADRLNWLLLAAPGVVFQKDGSFLAGWRFRGPDPTSSPAEEVNRLARRVNEIFLPCTDRWCFHVDAYRTPSTSYAPAGAFPDAITRLLDEERRNAYRAVGARFETECYLTASYLPPPELHRRVERLFRKGGEGAISWSNELESFEKSLLDLSDRLTSLLLLDRLGSGPLLSHLYRALTGRLQRILPPFHGSYLDSILCHEPFIGDFAPRLGDLHLRLVEVDGYPDAVYPTVLQSLCELPFEYRWSSRILPLSPGVADPIIRRTQKQYYEKRKGAAEWAGAFSRGKEDPGNPELERMQEDAHARGLAAGASEAISINSSGKARYCFFNSVILLHRESAAAADADARLAVKAARDAGFTASVQTMHAAETFWGTLPGHGKPNLHRRLLSSRNISALLPVTSVWAGSAANPSPFYPSGSPPLLWSDTAGATPFRLSLHVGDVGHTIVVGATGAGKSTLLQLIAAQAFRYAGAQVFVFDRGRSFELLCRAAGGAHFTVRPGEVGGLAFQPLARVDDPAERAWAVDWLSLLVRMQGAEVTPSRVEALNHALGLLAADEPRYRTLTALTLQLFAVDRELGAALHVYSGQGPYGYLLDADEDVVSGAAFQVFEIQHLFDLGDAITVPTLLYLLHRLEGRFGENRPTYLIVDEAGSSLGHPTFESRVRQYAVTLRKHNVALILAFQDLLQLRSLPSCDTLLGACPTRLFLPNAEARHERIAAMYRGAGLNDREIELLAEAVPKRHYYLKSPAGSRLFELSLGPAARAFLFARSGLGAEGTLADADRLEAHHGPGWVVEWLHEAGAKETAGWLHNSHFNPERKEDDARYDEHSARGDCDDGGDGGVVRPG